MTRAHFFAAGEDKRGTRGQGTPRLARFMGLELGWPSGAGQVQAAAMAVFQGGMGNAYIGVQVAQSWLYGQLEPGPRVYVQARTR